MEQAQQEKECEVVKERLRDYWANVERKEDKPLILAHLIMCESCALAQELLKGEWVIRYD